jgi:dihydrodipicolinate synthase/N-acetylneuraminate lyase
MSAMVTPFDADSGLDLDAARRLARWLEEAREVWRQLSR